jgi:hypothetical protein
LGSNADALQLGEWMQFVETGALTQWSNLPLAWYVPEPADPAQVAAQLDAIVPDLVRKYAGMAALPCWHVVLALGLTFKRKGDAIFPTVPDARIADLVKLAETDVAAFDAAGWIAARHLDARAKMPPALRRFAVDALAGRTLRPKAKGRPRAADTPLRLMQFRLCRLVAHEAAIPLGEGGKKPDRQTFTACRAVAEAFKRAGKHTTHAQLHALCYNTQYADLRKLAEALGMLDFEAPGDG